MTIEQAMRKAELENEIDLAERTIKDEQSRQWGLYADLNTSHSIQNKAIDKRAKAINALFQLCKTQ